MWTVIDSDIGTVTKRLEMKKKYQVFISSTYEDLLIERQMVIQALLEHDCIPAGMELFPAANERQWSLIKRVIKDSDYFLTIIGGRYGSRGPNGQSYTQMEYEYANSIGKPVIAFLHDRPEELAPKRIEQNDEGRRSLEKFRRIIKNRVVKSWNTPEGLASAVKTSITKLIDRYPQPGWVRDRSRIEGRRLYEHAGYYPIELAPGNIPYLHAPTFVKAIKYLLAKDTYDRLAAMDLVYLREQNLGIDNEDVLKRQPIAFAKYKELVERYDLLDFIKNIPIEDEQLFGNYRRMVDDIGETLKGVFLELLIHNVRNPVHSIIACKNSEGVSGRKLLDPSTRFVVQFVRDQGRRLVRAMQGGDKIAYVKHFQKDKWVKATTTPLYDDRYGLIAILCLNIDIAAIQGLKKGGQVDFLRNYIQNTGHTPDFEL
jgi:hypothetical protein